jgi:CDP-diacylglycerol--glycerol-3-phosphate 3-phosphatidyltransferase
MAAFVFLTEKSKARYLRVIQPAGNLFATLGVHPNILSICGLLLSLLAGLVYSTGAFFWAAWVVVLAGTCDALDGQLARQTGKNSPFGAFLDSVLDRFGEIFMFIGMAWYYAGGFSLLGGAGGHTSGIRSPVAVLLVFLALGGSLMVAYTRARAEGLGAQCKVGWMQRPERIVLLIIGSLLHPLPIIGPNVMKLALFLLAVLANVTAVQRIVHVRKTLIQEKRIP